MKILFWQELSLMFVQDDFLSVFFVILLGA